MAATAQTSWARKHSVLALWPRVAELVAQNASALANLRRSLLDPSGQLLRCSTLEIDDVTMVRYLMFHNLNVDEAAAALRRTVQWRESRRELLEAIRRGEKAPEEDRIRSMADIAVYPTSTGACLIVVRPGRSNPARLADTVPRPVLLDFMLVLRERAFQVCDVVTRGTGRLSRAVIAVDLTDISPWKMSKRFISIAGESTRLSDDYFPMLVERMALINAPSFISMILSVARRFLSEKTQQLLAECPSAGLGGDVATCPFAHRRFLAEDVPESIGGSRTGPPPLHARAAAEAALAHLLGSDPGAAPASANGPGEPRVSCVESGAGPAT